MCYIVSVAKLLQQPILHKRPLMSSAKRSNLSAWSYPAPYNAHISIQGSESLPEGLSKTRRSILQAIWSLDTNMHGKHSASDLIFVMLT